MKTQFNKVGNIWPSMYMAKKTKNTRKPSTMKTVESGKSQVVAILFVFLFSLIMSAQAEGWNPELVSDSEEALQTMLENKPKLESLYNKSYGYAIFPRVTKAGIAFGGAFGKGIVFKGHKVVGISKLRQASVGLQFGGQQYREIIFFENEASFGKFINGKLKFDAQASAVALKDGASIDVAYQDGVAVFTQTKGGLMYEASIGGQYFKFVPATN